MLSEGDQVPDFALKDAEGKTVKKSDLKGKKFGEKMKVPFILLADTEKDVAKKFGVWGKKQFMGREYMGVNRTTFLVDEKGKILKVFEKVKPAGHAQEVLDAFKN